MAIFASLTVALTITPAMSLLLLPGRRSDRHRESPLITLLKIPYRGVLPISIRRPALSVVALVGLLAGTLATVPYLGEDTPEVWKQVGNLAKHVVAGRLPSVRYHTI